MKLSKIAVRNIFRNRRRSILSVTAVAVAALSITLLFALFEGIKDDIRLNAWRYESGEVRIRNTEFDRYEYLNPVQYVVPNYRDLSAEMLQREDVSQVSPRISIPSSAFIGERQVHAAGLGVDIENEREFMNLDDLIQKGRLPEPGTSEALLASRLADELPAGIGDSVTFLTQTSRRTSNAFTVDVVGLVRFPVAQLDLRTFILPIDRAERYMLMEGSASEILVMGEGSSSETLAEDLNKWLTAYGGDTLAAAPWTEIAPGYGYMEMAGVVYNIIALFFFLLGSTVIINTTMMTIHERTKEIGTLSALGMRRGELVRLFFTEGTYLGLAGSFLGVMIGSLIVFPLQQSGIDLGASIDIVDMGMSSLLYPKLNMRSTAGTFLFSAAVAMAASYFPSRRAAKLKPVDALRG